MARGRPAAGRGRGPALTMDEAMAKNGLAVLREVFDQVERERWFA
jgi:hypothetical protein